MDKDQIFDVKIKNSEAVAESTEEELSNGKGDDE